MNSKSRNLEDAYQRLIAAVAAKRSTQFCHRLWSRFIRMRDGGRCVMCHSGVRVAAHHVFRKSLFDEMRFQTGNGITLCADCHRQPHEVFNGRPDISLPMDAEGGENIDLAIEFLEALIESPQHTELLDERYYHFSDHALGSFKRAQGVEVTLQFPGSRIEQARLIWRQTPRGMMRALLEANGLSLPDGLIQHYPGVVVFRGGEARSGL